MGRGLSRQPRPSCSGIADFAAIILATHNFPQSRLGGLARATSLLRPDLQGDRRQTGRCPLTNAPAGCRLIITIRSVINGGGPLMGEHVEVAGKAEKRWTRRKDARPAEIVAAALACFAERGFAGTRLDDVASRAGVTKGTVYL